MLKFSERYGYTKIERAFQRERVDDTLRIALWNVLSLIMWNEWQPYEYGYTEDSKRINRIVKRLWFHYFKFDLDRLPVFMGSYGQGGGAYDIFKEKFLKCNWYEVYNFIEFIAQDSETFRRLSPRDKY